ncbi:sensor histidine kinase [Nocardioides caldifontis]|uniref:sensor histidine kinase n=1 Tax=Nocardioides caldifontis TaxID=2588938 RepID=UPI001EEF7F55|nr:HAMP domain-containing sensor histidine kinase [Nocardioides caldifontis]
MRLLPATLTARLVVTAVALVALVSLLIGGAATAAIRSYLTDQLDADLARSAERASDLVARGVPLDEPPAPPGEEPGGRGDPAGRPDDDIGFGQRVGTLTAYLGDGGSWGNVIALDEGRADWAELSDDALAELETLRSDGDPRTLTLDGFGDYRVRAEDVGDALLVSGLPLDDVEDTVGNLIAYELVLSLAGIGLAGAAAWVLVRRQMRPLRDVASTAHAVAGLPLSSGEIGVTARVPERLTDERTEVGQVGAALNTLLGHVESALDDRHRSEQQVRRFVADASHELRTPLAVISGYAELSRRTYPHDPERLVESMAKVQVEAARMGSLVEDLLLLARLDAGRPLERGSVDLTRLVLEAVADSRVVAPEHRWSLDLPGEPVEVTGDEQRLHQVISNLLSNARRHTPAGTHVTAGVRPARGGGVVLTVTDDGPGIDPELAGRVFERFARGDSSRTRTSGGVGLGLSLVQAIVEAHGGTISVASAPGATCFEVTLPA